MNILFLSDNFPPEVNAPANRTFEHCVEWVKAGMQVTVITCAPNFPQGKVYEGYRNKLYQEEQIAGIRVIRVWSYVTANEGFLKRVLDYISFAWSAFWAGLFKEADIIIATSPQFFAAVGGYALARVRRKPWIMEVRDLWPESIRAVNAMQASRVLDWLEKLELHLYRHARQVVVVTDAFKENIRVRGIDPDKIQVVKNGVHLGQYRPEPKDAGLLAELGLEGKFIVSYIGTHGMAHKLDFILQSFRQVTDPDLHFILIGDGAEKAKLLALKEKLGLKNVTMLDSVPKQEINRYIAGSDVALVNLKKSDTFKTVIPSKIFENAAMEKPILLGVEGESKDIIEQYGAGLCFEPENEADFLEKLTRLKQDAAFYRQCQTGCRQLAKDFDRSRLAAEMLEVILEVLGKAPRGA